ncbi:MAG: inositol monophosphatase [Victivallales bacterium]|nr:inositol monophosphatase [Victivallales bacterium]
MTHFSLLGQAEVFHKGRIDLVTVADQESESYIKEALHAAYPEIGFHGEEGGGSVYDQGRLFVADPLDGTTNFVHGLPLFCVSIAYVVDGQPQAGVVYAPYFDEFFWAAKGEGAWHDGRRIHVSTTANLVDAELEFGFSCVRAGLKPDTMPIASDFVYRAQCIRALGSAALALCYVADGRFDGFWEYYIRPWDWAAAQIIIEEAGGKLTDFRGGPVDWRTGRVLASNGLLHEQMMAVFAERHQN